MTDKFTPLNQHPLLGKIARVGNQIEVLDARLEELQQKRLELDESFAKLKREVPGDDSRIVDIQAKHQEVEGLVTQLQTVVTTIKNEYKELSDEIHNDK
ncbi:hypothetical protein HY969_02240 [Candidatus Kaiserbacteria bacterium]|nr:hypothetical protein [Candidatus Kaiserbacteria bacterium]